MHNVAAIVAAITGPLGLAVGAGVVLIVLGLLALDSARQRARRVSLTVLSRASRASTLADCPPEFHARLRAAMGLEESDVA